MYHAIVRNKLRSVWRVINTGEYEAAVRQAAPNLAFRFLGDTALGADLTGRDEFRAWFGRVFEIFPGISFEVRDVIVAGWPWNTTFAVRLVVRAPLADGTAYENEAVQWGRLRWGRLVEDIVQEDTLRLADALRRQADAGRRANG
jgi:ketosteroid isomerase-like protein